MSEHRSTPSTSWADDSDGSDGETEFRENMAIPASISQKHLAAKAAGEGKDKEGKVDSDIKKDESDQPVASLASRISGLSTSNTPSTTTPTVPPPAASPSRPRPQAQVANNLFGRALAGVKNDRAPPASSASPASTSTPTPAASSSSAPQLVEKEGESSKGKELLPESSERKDGKMTYNLMDDDTYHADDRGMNADDGGWGPSSNNGNGNRGIRDDGWGNQSGNNNDNGNNGDGWGGPMRNGGNGNDTLDAPMGSEGGASGLISNDFQVEVKLADLQADPNSPLYSAKAFEKLGMHEDLLKGVYGVGFKKPSKIQERALPLLLANPPRNLIGQSQSGTGKTAAFALNVLSRIDYNMVTPQAIILAPSRELARQIQKVIDEIAKFLPVKTHLAVPANWRRNTKLSVHVLIGTPGTIMDMLSRGDTIFDRTMIRVLVLDEADEMVALQGLGDQTTRIKRNLPAGTQNVLFSATFPDEVRAFADSFAPEANQIYLKKEDVTVAAITQLYLECDGEDAKFNALTSLYDVMTIGQSIVFCKRRATADFIAQKLTDLGHSVASLHGEKQSGDRDDILDSFRNGKTKVLITTNVVARGIDIQQVNMVVNYDVPDMGPEGGFKPDVETYIHRIGRTGRFGRKGCAVTFAHDSRSKADVMTIMEETGKSMKKIDVARSTDIEQLEKALKAAMKGPA